MIAITLDIDWAPDFVIDRVAATLLDHQVKATWFVTHASEAVERLGQHPDLFELGIHPNCLPGSSHGVSDIDVLETCMKLVPDAVSMRTHGLYQSTGFLANVLANTPIRHDVSLFLPYAAHLAPVDFIWGGRRLTRLPFFWEDDYEMEQPTPDWSVEGQLARSDALRIINFHPIHIALNAPDVEPYRRVKTRRSQLTDCRPEDVEPEVHQGPGPGTFFRDLVSRLTAGESWQIKDLAEAYESRRAGTN
ncbi:MAG: hypothetical protein AAF492_23295 [Verrucomicrobiota bacterium]